MQRLKLSSEASASIPTEVRAPTIFPPAAEQASTVCGALSRFLADVGVQQAFGLVGGAIGPFADALLRSPIDVVHCRHEGGAAFAAAEASLASQRPTLVFTTTGPGLFNALNGIAAARWDGAHVIVVSGSTSASQRGRLGIQETSAHTMPISGLYTSGPLFHYAAQLEDPAQLPQVIARISAGLQKPQGFVCHVSLPVNVQSMHVPQPLKTPTVDVPTLGISPSTIEDCVARLSEHKFALCVGFGARHAASEIRELAHRTGCGVMATPRGKGIFSEADPRFVGVTGLGGHASVAQYMRDEQPHSLVVLGTRLGEGSTFWSQDLTPPGGFVHVDVDADVFGAAYPQVATVGIQADIGEFLRALLKAWPCATHHAVRSRARPSIAVERLTAQTGLCRPAFIMQCVQDTCIDTHHIPVMAESGNTFAWANHLLRFHEHTYRVSPGYGSMGHFVAGVVGASLARKSKVVALVGDGAMLMNNEISTAVRYGAPAIWVVLNDSQYGMVEHCMRAQGYAPVETMIPGTDFALLAQGQGAQGIHVDHECELPEALERAVQCAGPVVIDVTIDPNIPPPVFARVESLANAGATTRQGSRA